MRINYYPLYHILYYKINFKFYLNFIRLLIPQGIQKTFENVALVH